MALDPGDGITPDLLTPASLPLADEDILLVWQGGELKRVNSVDAFGLKLRLSQTNNNTPLEITPLQSVPLQDEGPATSLRAGDGLTTGGEMALGGGLGDGQKGYLRLEAPLLIDTEADPAGSARVLPGGTTVVDLDAATGGPDGLNLIFDSWLRIQTTSGFRYIQMFVND